VTALVTLEAIVIVLLVVLVAGLLRSHAEILRQLHELGAGGDAEHHDVPAVGPAGRRRKLAVDSLSGVTPDGKAAVVALTGSRGAVLVAFLTTGCATCRPLWRHLARGVTLPNPDVRIVVVTKGPEEESPGAVRNLAAPGVTVIMGTAAWDDFAVPVAPFFALVDARNGTVIGEGAAASWAQVGDLMRRAMGDTPRGGLHAGTAARVADTDEELRRAGIGPDDPTLHRPPTDGRAT
jgi:hypothetical protein